MFTVFSGRVGHPSPRCMELDFHCTVEHYQTNAFHGVRGSHHGHKAAAPEEYQVQSQESKRSSGIKEGVKTLLGNHTIYLVHDVGLNSQACDSAIPYKCFSSKFDHGSKNNKTIYNLVVNLLFLYEI